MASYQVRQRDPLLDQNMQAALEKRGKELLGLGLVALAVLAAMMLGSYSADDPSFLASTDQPAQNLLGRLGAAIASPLYVIAGHGAWGIAICLFAWGVRFITHRGEDRALGRVIFAPIGIAVLSVYCSTLVPGASWGHSFGLGGLFGDTILGTLIGVSPIQATFGLKLLSLLLAIGVLAIGAFVTGFDRLELRQISRFLMVGSVLVYSRLLTLAGRSADFSLRAAQGAAQTAAQKARDRREASRMRALEDSAWQDAAHAVPQARVRRAEPMQAYEPADYIEYDQPQPEPMAHATSRVLRAEPRFVEVAEEDEDLFEAAEPDYDWPATQEAQPQRGGLFSRVLRRQPEPDHYGYAEPELVERGLSRQADLAEGPSEDRIKARIADAVASRNRLVAERPAAHPQPEAHAQRRTEPPVRGGLLGRAAAAAAGPLLAARSAVAAPVAPVPAPAAEPVEMPLRAEPRFMPLGRAAAPAPQRVAEPPLTAAHAARAAHAAPEPRLAQPSAPLAQIPTMADFDDIQAFETGRDDLHSYGAPLPYEDAMPPASQVLSALGEPDPEAADGWEGDDWREQSHYGIEPQMDDDEADHMAFAQHYDMPEAAAPALGPSRSLPPAEPRRVVQHVAKKPAQPSTRARAEAEPRLQFDEVAEVYEAPPLSLLTNPATIERHQLSDDALEENARMLENVLDDYGVKGEIVSVRPGPVVTLYELEPAPGLKASRVIGLSDDIARSMSALSARVSTVPGRTVIGIELPNAHREKVLLRENLAARDFGDSAMKLPLALGKDIAGEPVVANLAKMPHLLIAGTTGSGKSVAINTMILSLLYKLSPEECRLIMIDPKMLELSVYDGIPHLLSPVVTDPKKAVVALKWVVGEMEERYRKMSKMGVRNIDGYNGRVKEALAKGEMFKRTVQTGFEEETGEPIFETEEFQPRTIPYIVVIVDEMADLMMVAGKEIEACIQRLAQMARASGIHLIMATQRPSVDVITGTIKANFPTRISFQVTSKIDSRTILGEMGAEQLLGMGDMLYMAGGSRITRIHGPFVSDEEVEEVVTHLKSFGPPEYISGVVEGLDEDKADNIDAVLGLGGNTDAEDSLYDQAVQVVLRDRKVSTSYIQRKLGIGYNKAAKLVEQMEGEGVISAANHVGKREILVPEQ